MRKSVKKLAMIVGLGATLVLPGLAAAETRHPHSFKQSVQHQSRDQNRHGAQQHVRHDRHDRKYHDKHHNRHQRKEHGHRHGHHHPGRWGYTGQYGHYHQGRYCNVNHVHGYRHINGYYVTPHLGLHFILR